MKRFLGILLVFLLLFGVSANAIDIATAMGGGVRLQRGETTKFAPMLIGDVTVKSFDSSGFRLVNKTQYSYVDPTSAGSDDINTLSTFGLFEQKFGKIFGVSAGSGLARELRTGATDATYSVYKTEIFASYKAFNGFVGCDWQSREANDVYYVYGGMNIKVF